MGHPAPTNAMDGPDRTRLGRWQLPCEPQGVAACSWYGQSQLRPFGSGVRGDGAAEDSAGRARRVVICQRSAACAESLIAAQLRGASSAEFAPSTAQLLEGLDVFGVSSFGFSGTITCVVRSAERPLQHMLVARGWLECAARCLQRQLHIGCRVECAACRKSCWWCDRMWVARRRVLPGHAEARATSGRCAIGALSGGSSVTAGGLGGLGLRVAV